MMSSAPTMREGFMGVAWDRLLALALLGSYLAAALKMDLSNPLFYLAVAGPLALLVVNKAVWKNDRLTPVAAALMWLLDVGFAVTTYILKAVQI